MRDKILVIVFAIYILVFAMLNIFSKDVEISNMERRKLMQFPKISLEALVDKSFFGKFDKYSSDQFVFRDSFRKVKSIVALNLLKNLDTNKVYIIDKNAFKLEYPMNIEAMDTNINKINTVINMFNTDSNIYFSIIPDKNYYRSDSKYPKINYEDFFEKYQKEINAKYINIVDTLTINSYYKTDPHWIQKELLVTSEKILKEMKNEKYDNKYEEIYLGDFFGSYYNEILFGLEKDKLIYLTNDRLKNVEVKYLENKKLIKTYNEEKISSYDPYDVYLDGASSLIEIANPNSSSNKELIIFRDSFGSAISPLLIAEYTKVTIIDIRYIRSDLIKEYINLNADDVIFIYSTMVLNSSTFK